MARRGFAKGEGSFGVGAVAVLGAAGKVAPNVAEGFGTAFGFLDGFLVEGELGGVVDGGVGQGHELVEDTEFEFEFDAVDH